ncbi:MAG: recombinase RecA, partial [Rhodococcus sp. (in: high G+C Gram-positive bacteria)]|nr:recombinase RecA [Rhodococcus sp. (in: high G+C Gram-positive bacteria)]
MSENFEADQNTDGANPDVRELSEVPAVEVISRAAVMLMSSAAEKLG